MLMVKTLESPVGVLRSHKGMSLTECRNPGKRRINSRTPKRARGLLVVVPCEMGGSAAPHAPSWTKTGAVLPEGAALPKGAAQWAAHWKATSRSRSMPPPTPAPQPTLPRAADASTTEVEPMTADVTLRHQMLLPLAGSLPTPPAAIVAVALAKAAAEAKAAVEAATATRSRLEEEARVVRKRPRPPSASPAAQRPYTRCQDGIAGGASLSSLQPLRPPPPPRSPPPSRLLHDQISGLAALAAPDAHEHALRQETAQAYAALVAGAIPGAQVCLGLG